MAPRYSPIAIARQFLYVREIAASPNRGLRVEAIQHWANGQPGDSWCMEFVWMVFDIAYRGEAPFGRMQAVSSLHDLAKIKGWMVTDPRAGDLVLSVNDANHAHHIALVTRIDPLSAIAGNTSADGTSANGDRVAEHAISQTGKVFVRIPS